MALQDLTPQLRTRLSRMERAVGWFVLLATLLLVSGFAYYVYHLAKNKGWFLTKAPYQLYIERATGLKVGDPVTLMGFPAGQITLIDAMPPDWVYSPVNVQIEIQAPYYGYVWTVGSVAKVTSTDLLGKRSLEITKGTQGYPTYMFNPLRILSLEDAAALTDPARWKLAQEIPDAAGTNVVVPALRTFSKQDVDLLAGLGRKEIRLFDTREQRKSMTAVWDEFTKRYDFYGRTNMYWLLVEEAPAVSEQLDRIVGQVTKALPGVFALTNQLAEALANTATLTSNLNAIALSTRPAVANLTAITDDLRGRGALGEWLLPTNLHAQIEATLTNTTETLAVAKTALSDADTNLVTTLENLNRSLENLAGITGNLNAQVQANTNILRSISDAIVHSDEFIQGLKRHWLFRSAFKTPKPPETNAPTGILRSPKDAAER